MKLKVYSPKPDSAKTVEASDEIFQVAQNDTLLAQALRRYSANQRQSNAQTKNRGQVSGGGKKPFRQKGTGRARAGSSRSPLWIGGGVTFGPTNARNFRQRLNRKMGAKAIKILLSEKARSNKLVIVPEFKLDKISTKAVQTYLEKLPIEEGNILIVLGQTNANLELSTANLPYLKTTLANGFSLMDLAYYDYLLTDMAGIKAIEANFSDKNRPEEKPAPAKKPVKKVKEK